MDLGHGRAVLGRRSRFRWVAAKAYGSGRWKTSTATRTERVGHGSVRARQSAEPPGGRFFTVVAAVGCWPWCAHYRRWHGAATHGCGEVRVRIFV
ncbi:uncharacterized protein M6B38_272530 [Iris pallida]|uniref:Uncharacterized protein n=1 Tax=Iris pallida TaxID=29817 RepID=A0AAX6I679_IRIPA|nr:uncharacterized protein M6B38_272530 [Iris pallida]